MLLMFGHVTTSSAANVPNVWSRDHVGSEVVTRLVIFGHVITWIVNVSNMFDHVSKSVANFPNVY